MIQKNSIYALIFFLIVVRASSQEIEPLEIKRSNVDSETIVEKLHIVAYRYNLNLGEKNDKKLYYMQAERWNSGEIVETWKTKTMSLEPKTGKGSFFVSFPLPPRMDIMVHADTGRYTHEVLPFEGNKTIDCGCEYIEKISSKDLIEGNGVILGYLVRGYAGAPEDDGSSELWPNYKNFKSAIDAYQKTILKYERVDVDIIIYKLLLHEIKER